MKQKFLALVLLCSAFVFGMSPEEFEQLYSTPNKNGEVCYRLYQAYAQGDGVEKNDSQARKWLLAAHRCGKEGAGAELVKLPWREKYKKPGQPVQTDDAAARAKGEELVRLLMQASGPEMNAIITMKELELSKEETAKVKQLIAEGADLNVVVVGKTETEFYTALSIACHHGNLELAQLLIENGADPCACSYLALERSLASFDEHSRAFVRANPKYAKLPALHIKTKPASKNHAPLTGQEIKSANTVEFLIHNGLDVNLWTDYGWSLAMLVSQNDNLMAADMLAKAGMDVSRRANPRECVASALSPNRMKYLMNTGSVQNEGTALIRCIRNYKDMMVEELLRLGADPTMACGDMTPMAYVEQNEQHMRSSSNERFRTSSKNILKAMEKALRKWERGKRRADRKKAEAAAEASAE